MSAEAQSRVEFRIMFKPGGRRRWWYVFVNHRQFGERRLICYASARPGVPFAQATQGAIQIRFAPMPAADVTPAVRRMAVLQHVLDSRGF